MMHILIPSYTESCRGRSPVYDRTAELPYNSIDGVCRRPEETEVTESVFEAAGADPEGGDSQLYRKN